MPPVPPPEDLPGGVGGFLEWLLELCAALGITISQEVLGALKRLLSQFLSYTIKLSALGLSLAFSWAAFT